MANRMLIISLEALLLSLRQGDLSSEKLENALFILGVPRYVIEELPEYPRGYAGLNWVGDAALAQRRQICVLAQQAILKAEQEGRVMFDIPYHAYDALNEMLVENGYEEIEVKDGRFKPSHVIDQIEQKAIDLEVLWN